MPKKIKEKGLSLFKVNLQLNFVLSGKNKKLAIDKADKLLDELLVVILNKSVNFMPQHTNATGVITELKENQ